MRKKNKIIRKVEENLLLNIITLIAKLREKNGNNVRKQFNDYLMKALIEDYIEIIY